MTGHYFMPRKLYDYYNTPTYASLYNYALKFSVYPPCLKYTPYYVFHKIHEHITSYLNECSSTNNCNNKAQLGAKIQDASKFID